MCCSNCFWHNSYHNQKTEEGRSCRGVIMHKVSIIIPAYNAEPYIAQCANSVLHQTMQDIEIIFINDGSTDKTGENLDRLTNGHSNARVIHQGNKGLYKTREIGLSFATGDYVGWIDADDCAPRRRRLVA